MNTADVIIIGAGAAGLMCAIEAGKRGRRVSVLDHSNKVGQDFKVSTPETDWHCESLLIATGGLSIPTMGATLFGYKIAEQFGLRVWPTRAALVPLTLHEHDKEELSPLSGVSTPCSASVETQSFTEDLLFTHRGLSGPAILQISS